jgi:hypothetical protein
MYSTAFEALETADLDLLRTVLEDVRLDRGIVAPDGSLDDLACDLVNLWLAGFRGSEELKAMLKPIDLHLCQ